MREEKGGVKGRIGGEMKTETIEALHTLTDRERRPAVCESVDVTSEWKLSGAKAASKIKRDRGFEDEFVFNSHFE